MFPSFWYNFAYVPKLLKMEQGERRTNTCQNDADGCTSGPRTTLIPDDGLLPSYLAAAFQDLYEEDGVCVMGKGLGCLQLLASFVRFYADTEEGHAAMEQEEDREDEMENNDGTPTASAVIPPFVVVIGLKDSERQALANILHSWGTPPYMMPKVITNEQQGKDRSLLYKERGVFCITSRILIVDLLTSVLTANEIDGMLVMHADHVDELSTEAFILRIFLNQKQPYGSGFVKGFCDSPESVVAGFAKADKILKALHVRKFYLYPRFHDLIREELEGHPPDIVEMIPSLTPLQKEIQICIAAAVQSCMREIKKATPKLQWNTPELSIENCVTSEFDRLVSGQLEHDWHHLAPQTKQLVQDLRTLRTLFQSLIQYDSVSFWKLINTIKTMSASSRYPSLWLLSDAANGIFKGAKDRLYTIERTTKKSGEMSSRLRTILEENPKWKLLRQTLAEIGELEKDRMKRRTEPTTVLVLVKDGKTLSTVRSYLVDGRQRTMNSQWLRFLEQYNDRSRSITDGKGGTSALSEESRLLLEEESRIRRILHGDAGRREARAKRRNLNAVPDYIRKRRRVAVEKGRGTKEHQVDDLAQEAVLDDAVEETEHAINVTAKDLEAGAVPGDLDFNVVASFEPDDLRIIIHSYDSIEDDELLFLHDKQPQYIVLYDSSLAFIRAIEVYAALKARSEKIFVYFLMFEASSEEKNFHKNLEREKKAFERLIQHIKTMPPPIVHAQATQEMQLALHQGSHSSSYFGGTLPLAFDSRKGGGRINQLNERRDIVVDVREFRSALPSILHQGGMRLAPATLIVGDFVLSKVHCVERKSISDLFGSFASGRLYTQVESMSKYYKVPCLLIEFDPSKSFSLQNVNEIGNDIRSDSICSKMVLLVMSFPKLRILWSRGPHHTLDIFRDLKRNHEEVDVERAIEVGRDESVEALLSQNGEVDDEDDINEVAREMLLRLPGVTIHIARKIMKHVDSLAELIQMSREDLRRVAGPSVGQKLFTFFRQRV